MRPSTTALIRVVTFPLVGLLALSMVLTMAPAHAQKIKPDYFGMHDANWTTQPPVAVGAANFTTSATYWQYVERRKGRFAWSHLDSQVRAAEAMGAKPMIVLGRTPKFHSSRSRAADFYSYMPSMKAWNRWVSKVANRYGKRLDYQIWPEPNITQNWKGTSAQLAKLTASASRIIKRANRRAKVVGPAMTLRLAGQRRSMLNYYKQSVGGRRIHTYLDVIAIDTFPEQDGMPEDAYGLMKLAKKQLARIGVKRKPFWNNEINYGVAGGGQETTTTYPLAMQQSLVIRTYALSAAARMARTYWLGWFNTKTMAVSMTDANGNKAAPGTSYEVVRNWMLGTGFSGCRKDSVGLWTCTAKTATTTRKIYWMQAQNRSKNVFVPARTTRIENQSGVDQLTSYPPGTAIAVDYKPIMIEVLN